MCCPHFLPLQRLCLPTVCPLNRLPPFIMVSGLINVPRSLHGYLLLFRGLAFIPRPNQIRCLPKPTKRLRPILPSMVTRAAGLSRSCISFFTIFSGPFFVGSSLALFPPRGGNVPRPAWHGEGRPSRACELSRLACVLSPGV